MSLCLSSTKTLLFLCLSSTKTLSNHLNDDHSSYTHGSWSLIGSRPSKRPSIRTLHIITPHAGGDPDHRPPHPTQALHHEDLTANPTNHFGSVNFLVRSLPPKIPLDLSLILPSQLQSSVSPVRPCLGSKALPILTIFSIRLNASMTHPPIMSMISMIPTLKIPWSPNPDPWRSWINNEWILGSFWSDRW